MGETGPTGKKFKLVLKTIYKKVFLKKSKPMHGSLHCICIKIKDICDKYISNIVFQQICFEGDVLGKISERV